MGIAEIIAGGFILIGFLTRPAALAMLINMSVAMVITKIPILFGESFDPFILRDLKFYGFWSMAHEIRTDFAMWLGSLFLMLKGGGKWSLDSTFIKHTRFTGLR